MILGFDGLNDNFYSYYNENKDKVCDIFYDKTLCVKNIIKYKFESLIVFDIDDKLLLYIDKHIRIYICNNESCTIDFR